MGAGCCCEKRSPITLEELEMASARLEVAMKKSIDAGERDDFGLLKKDNIELMDEQKGRHAEIRFSEMV